MLDLRATYLNGKRDAFWNFHDTQEDERLYGRIREGWMTSSQWLHPSESRHERCRKGDIRYGKPWS